MSRQLELIRRDVNIARPEILGADHDVIDIPLSGCGLSGSDQLLSYPDLAFGAQIHVRSKSSSNANCGDCHGLRLTLPLCYVEVLCFGL